MALILFRGGNLLDPNRDELLEGHEVLIEDDKVREVSDRPIKSPGAQVVNLGGRTIMPGLIDAHIHVYLSEVNIALLEGVPPSLMTARAGTLMKAMLERGFTTVRDTAGADWGIQQAVAEGLLVGPRLFIAGQAISQTGGHSDFRRRTQSGGECGCCAGIAMIARIVDGVPAMLHAVRDELRKGADHIKLMVSGGVSSPLDPLEGLQFSLDEIRAATEEATGWGSYVCAHAYGANAIARAVANGVRTIEHGNLIDAPTAALMAQRGAFLVPTLVAYDAMRRRGRDFGMPEVSMVKNDRVLKAGLQSLEIAKAAGVQIGFGSDLLGQLQVDQSREFLIRAEVLSPREIIHSATIVNARLLRREGQLGILAPDAIADVLVIDGNPLKDVGLFQDDGAHIPLIMQSGRFYKNRLAA